MSALTLTKNYADSTLLMVTDIHGMWDELETKTNGNITSEHVNSGWASFSQATLSQDVDYTLGTTASSYFYYKSTTDEMVYAFVTTQRDVLFKLGGTLQLELDEVSDLHAERDIYFFNYNTTYPLSYLVGYQKPVLIYEDSTTVYVEQNTTTANRTLVVFPVGPIAVTENIASSHKFRMLKLDAVANGYSSGHTGAADSGLQVGLTLTANTWYFVYAVVVQGGDDAATDNFVLVVDDLKPLPTNWGSLDSAYGAGKWVYIGALRYGHGSTNSEELVAFVQDHSGWMTFTSRGGTDDFFGIKLGEYQVSSTSVGTMQTITPADSGNAVPTTMSHYRLSIRTVAVGAEMCGSLTATDGSDNLLWNLPSFAANLTETEAHGWDFKVPNITSIKIKGETGA
jgi:hypothetical protein